GSNPQWQHGTEYGRRGAPGNVARHRRAEGPTDRESAALWIHARTGGQGDPERIAVRTHLDENHGEVRLRGPKRRNETICESFAPLRASFQQDVISLLYPAVGVRLKLHPFATL